MVKKTTIWIGGLSVVLLLTAAIVFASTWFKDLKEDHWAYDSVMWGVSEGIINGYPDNTFRTEKNVTNAEFLKILVGTYKTYELKAGEGEQWYGPYYTLAKENNWAIMTTSDSGSVANVAITRGQVARLLASADGELFPLEKDAILYLYDKGYSNGKTSKTVEGYEASQNLKRSEAIQFVNNFVKLRKNDELIKAEPKPVKSSLPAPDFIEGFVKEDSNVKEVEVTSYVAGEYTHLKVTYRETSINVSSFISEDKGVKTSNVSITTKDVNEDVVNLFNNLTSNKLGIKIDSPFDSSKVIKEDITYFLNHVKEAGLYILSAQTKI